MVRLTLRAAGAAVALICCAGLATPLAAPFAAAEPVRPQPEGVVPPESDIVEIVLARRLAIAADRVARPHAHRGVAEPGLR